MENVENLIKLHEEAVGQLNEDLINVETDTGRTVILDALKDHENELVRLKRG